MGIFIIKKKIEGLLKCYKFKQNFKKNIKDGSNGIMLISTPSHGNLGDHAIYIAELQLLQKLHPKIKFIDLNDRQIGRIENIYAINTPPNIVIAVHGGGFLGSLWPQCEYRFRRTLQAFPNNKVIVFPQTITFDVTTKEGKAFLRESQKIYSAHRKLTIFVREKKSFAFMQQYFPTVKCILVPDIVTILDISLKEEKRNGILFCMRHDLEKTLDKNSFDFMQKVVHQKYPNEEIMFTDTVIGEENIYLESKENKKYVIKKMEEFKRSKLVVTDRLHGMIFAALTDTPCIAINNTNGKVQAVYDWIRSNEYIRFVNSMENFKSQLESLDLQKQYHYNKVLIEKAFAPLFKELEEMI